MRSDKLSLLVVRWRAACKAPAGRDCDGVLATDEKVRRITGEKSRVSVLYLQETSGSREREEG